MMRVLVTGGNGNVGKAAVARLVKNGFSVKVIGRTAGVEIPGAGYEVCDINDYPHLREAVRGFEAIVHLAAIPSPSMGTSDQVFYANVQGTFNVYKAAEEEGIRRVVQACFDQRAGGILRPQARPDPLPAGRRGPSLRFHRCLFALQAPH